MLSIIYVEKVLSMAVSLSRLIIKNLNVKIDKGKKSGMCVFCGFHTDEGFEAEFPQTFISFDRVAEGDTICPYCYHIFKHPEFRRNSWLVTQNSFRFLSDRNEILNVLLESPKEPWMLYITKSRRKHGWIQIVNILNNSREQYIVGYDEIILMIQRSDFRSLINAIRRLREAKIPKSEIFTADFSASSMRKILDKKLSDSLNIIRMYSHSPILDLALFLSR